MLIEGVFDREETLDRLILNTVDNTIASIREGQLSDKPYRYINVWQNYMDRRDSVTRPEDMVGDVYPKVIDEANKDINHNRNVSLMVKDKGVVMISMGVGLFAFRQFILGGLLAGMGACYMTRSSRLSNSADELVKLQKEAKQGIPGSIERTKEAVKELFERYSAVLGYAR